MFVRRKGWVTINFTASRGRVTYFNKKYLGRAARFYIHAHGDSSGPPPFKKMNAPLKCSISFNLSCIHKPLHFLSHLLREMVGI